MDRAFGLLTSEIGFTLQEAAQATATEPARVLHLNHIGAIEVGKRADLVVWNDRVTHVIRQGTDV
jgi:imidazolonepropionase-like amidohydrolase